MNKQFDGYNDLHNTYSAKGHKPSKPELDRLADRPHYKALYENQLAVNKGLLWGLGITLALSTLLFTGMYSHNKADSSRLQKLYNTSYNYMIAYENERDYYRNELASASAELKMSKLSKKAQTHMKQQPEVANKIISFWGNEWVEAMELYSRESSLIVDNVNPSSGACGLIQFLPCSKLKCDLKDLDCQLIEGKKYIENRYGSPMAALFHHDQYNWY